MHVEKKQLSTGSWQGGWVQVRAYLYHGCAKVILLHSRHNMDELLFPQELTVHLIMAPTSPASFSLVSNASHSITWSKCCRLGPPDDTSLPSPPISFPQCSICILILIQQSRPAAPGASARPVKAQLARKWASHTFGVHRPRDVSFAGGEQSELNLPPGALWTPPTHCRYYHCTRQVRDASTVIDNVLCKYQLLFSRATESNSTPHIIVIK